MSAPRTLKSPVQPGTELRCLPSQTLNRNLHLYIKLPWRYLQTDAVYPVLFVLDANRSFFLYSTMSLIFETPPTASEELVAVGIGYKLEEDRIIGLAQWAAWRTCDLTPVRKEETERQWEDRLSALTGGRHIAVHTGGAAAFLESLTKEVIPFVEGNYRVSSADRGLAGYSFGGLFTLYALFHAPEAFTRYFAGSPSMWDELFEYEDHFASAHNDLQAKLLMTAGSLETDILEPLQRMAARLRSRRYPSLAVQTLIFEGEGHESAYAAAASVAIRLLYGARQVSGSPRLGPCGGPTTRCS